MQKAIDIVGKEHFIALVTDNGSNMRAARRLLLAKPGYGHIIELRYMRRFDMQHCLHAVAAAAAIQICVHDGCTLYGMSHNRSLPPSPCLPTPSASFTAAPCMPLHCS